MYSPENKLVFEKILKQSQDLTNLEVSKLEIDKNLINRIMNYASVKYIIQKNIHNDEKVLEIFYTWRLYNLILKSHYFLNRKIITS